MNPNTTNQIVIHGSERNAAQYLRDLERDVMRLHLRDYQRAGVPVPDVVIERARQMGIEVEA